MELAEWVNGEVEKPFYIDGMIVFVPDITCGDILYEVVYRHPLDGRKLGMIQAWSYFNSMDLDVYEISAEYILSQKKQPDMINVIEHYEIKIN